MNTMHKGIMITAEQVAQWLDAASDEEFDEALVWFWKKYYGDDDHVTKRDFENFNIDVFVEWLRDLLQNTVPVESEFNRFAWWKA